MTPKERRKYEAEKKKRERIEEDLQSEKLLKEQIEFEKRLVKSALPGSGLIVVERLRGLVRLEHDTTQDYQLTITNSFTELKPMKNQKARL